MFFDIEVVSRLEIEPEHLGGPEEPRQTEGGVGRDRSFPMNDLVDSPWSDAHVLGQSILTQAHRDHELLEENFAGMNGSKLAIHAVSSVVIDNLDLVRAGLAPGEADTPPVIDSDAPLPFPITREFLEPICRWDPEIFECCGCIEHPELSESNTLDIRRKLARGLQREQLLSFGVCPASYHPGEILTPSDHNV